MKYKFISDSHTHSENSFDGNDSVIMMCERAANLGLYSVTVTDHCECNEYYENEENVNYRKCIEDSIRDTAKARAMYISKVNIYTGIELGQPCQDRKAAEEVLSLAEYDFVLGSCIISGGKRISIFWNIQKRMFRNFWKDISGNCWNWLRKIILIHWHI